VTGKGWADFVPARGLLDFHYDTMKQASKERAERIEEREREFEELRGFTLGGSPYEGLPVPRRPFSAVSGYTGFMPRKESAGLMGCSHAKLSKLSRNSFMEVMAMPTC